MNFGQLLKNARIALADTTGILEQHHALTEEMALMYFNEAIHEACRRSRLIIDRSTAAVCSYAVTSGSPIITLHPSIIKVRKARLTSRQEPLHRIYAIEMDDASMDWETHTGTTDSYIADYEVGKICLYRIPEQNDTLKLVVVRLPLNDLATSSDIPEIPAQYHAALIPYVVAKVRNIEDSELYDPRKAAKAEAEFDREFGDKRTARDEVWEGSQPFEEYE